VSQVFSRIGITLMIETLLRTVRCGSSWSKTFWIVSSVAVTRHRRSGPGLDGRRDGALFGECRSVRVGGGNSGRRRSGDRERQIL
jgi:hypothetical protein